MRFTKMEGLGNDYIYIDLFNEELPDVDLSDLARNLSDRHFGIGSDGLVLIGPSKIADCRMQMYNSDGSEAEMCGNAVRCIAKIMFDKGKHDNGVMTIETLAGIKTAKVLYNNLNSAQVEVDMGAPILGSSRIPVELGLEKVIAHPLEVDGEKLSITCVSMGNPHCVLFVDDILDDMVFGLGKLIENHPIFPERTNVEFVKVLNRDHIRMRVWERGAGETLACGTGACASVVACVLNEKCDRQVKVDLLGGTLEILWLDDGTIRMIGPANIVFKGEIEI